MSEQNHMHLALLEALKGGNNVGSNPLVGTVITIDNQIIGKGYHAIFGGPHAEVNAINSLTDNVDLSQSTVYVTLEPCSHWGKTPPCAKLLIDKSVKNIVIAIKDPYEKVSGNGILMMQQAGIQVNVGKMAKEARWVNRRFLKRIETKRPWVILKWAESADDFIGSGTPHRQIISGQSTLQLIQQWRGFESAIAIGPHTALLDNPKLTNRSGKWGQPHRILFDRHLRVTPPLQLLDDDLPLTTFNTLKDEKQGNKVKIKTTYDHFITDSLTLLAEMGINSVIIEGGAQILRAFLKTDCWDEIRIIKSQHKQLGIGTLAPKLFMKAAAEVPLEGDILRLYYRDMSSVPAAFMAYEKQVLGLEN